MRTARTEDLNLANGSSLVMDLTSLGAVLAAADNIQLSAPIAKSHYRQKLQAGDFDTLQLFEVLSNFICFDQFLVDYRALNAFQGAPKLVAMLRRIRMDQHFCAVVFPSTSYQDAARNVIALRNKILENAPRALLKAEGGNLEKLFGYEETMGVDDATLTDMYDRRYFLERPDFPSELPRNFADTGMSIERLFVYLEVARSLDLPASLARSKYGALEEVGRKARAIASAIDRELTKQMLGTETGLAAAQDVVLANALPGVELPAPLLPAHVLRVAEQRACSIMDAVLAIRDDPAAEAFRNYLWCNRRSFDPVFAGEHLKAKKIRQTLAEIGKRIARANSATGVFNDMTRVTVNLSNIPILNILLKIIGKQKITIPLALPRRPPMYEVFIARWFR